LLHVVTIGLKIKPLGFSKVSGLFPKRIKLDAPSFLPKTSQSGLNPDEREATDKNHRAPFK
jgi:hypothetical protein